MIKIHEENRWVNLQIESSSNIPSIRSGQCSTLLANKFYIFGGVNQTDVLNDLHCFDVDLHVEFYLKYKSWSKISKSACQGEPPSARISAAMVGFMDKLYIFGGTSKNVQNVCKNDFFELSINSKCWRKVNDSSRPVPCERYGHSMISQDNSFYIFGGVRFVIQNNLKVPEFLNDLWKFSLIDKMWRKIEANGPIPQPRYRHGCLTIENRLYIVGGSSNLERYGQIYILDLDRYQWSQVELEAAKQKNKKNLFKGRYGHATFNIGDQIIIYGGLDDDSCLNDALQLDIKDNKWSRKRFRGQSIYYEGRSIPGRDFFSYAASSNYLILFGGKDRQNKRLNDIHQWYFTLKTNNQLYCTLRSDVFNLLSMDSDQNCSDTIVYNQNKQINSYIHSKLISIRSPNLKINNNEINLNYSDPVIELLLNYIYRGEIDFQTIQKVPIDQLIDSSIYLGLASYCLLIVLHLLIQAQSEDDYDYLAKSFTQTIMQKKVSNVFQSVQTLLDLRKKIKSNQKEQDKAKALIVQQDQLEKALFYNVREKCIEQFYIDLRSLQNQKESCDLKIKVLDDDFLCHQFIMLARCDYFKALITFDRARIQQQVVDLDGTLIGNDPKVMATLLSYLYGGYLVLTPNNAISRESMVKLFTLSNYFLLQNVSYLYLLQDGIASQITTENCFELMNLGDQLQANVIISKALNYMSNHLREIMSKHKEKLNSLNPEYLVELLQIQADNQ